MPAGGPAVITACNVEGEAASLPPGYLTSLLVAVPIAGWGSQQAEMVTQALGLSCRRIPHRRESRVSELCSFQANALRDLSTEEFLFLICL